MFVSGPVRQLWDAWQDAATTASQAVLTTADTSMKSFPWASSLTVRLKTSAPTRPLLAGMTDSKLTIYVYFVIIVFRGNYRCYGGDSDADQSITSLDQLSGVWWNVKGDTIESQNDVI